MGFFWVLVFWVLGFRRPRWTILHSALALREIIRIGILICTGHFIDRYLSFQFTAVNFTDAHESPAIEAPVKARSFGQAGGAGHHPSPPRLVSWAALSSGRERAG